MNKTKIEYVDYSWNPATGCKHGCSYCFARRIAERFKGKAFPNGFEPTFYPERLSEPMRVKKSSRIFVCDMSDLFGNWTWKTQGLEARECVVNCILSTVKQCPQHTFLFLTKNPAGYKGFEFPENCWLGASVENQEQADKRIPLLLQIPAAVRFVSVEPMLWPVDLDRWLKETCTNCGGIGRVPNHPHIPARICQRCKGKGKVFRPQPDWVICGCETGPGARRMNPDWARSLKDQCRAAGVPFFLKQMEVNGKVVKMPMLDGQVWDQRPEVSK